MGIIKVIYVYYLDDFFLENSIIGYSFKNKGVRSILLLNSCENILILLFDIEIFEILYDKVRI